MKKAKPNAKTNKNNKITVSSKSNPAKSNKPSAIKDYKQEKSSSKISFQKKVKNKVVDDTPRSQKLLHQIMPFVMYVLALFLVVAFIMIDLADNGEVMGTVGQGLHDLICGTLGIGAFFIPLLIVLLGVYWRRNIDDGIIGQKVLFAFLILLFISALFHVSAISKGDVQNNFDIIEMWKRGIEFIGGGMIGGILGNILHFAFGSVGSIIVVSSIVFIFSMFFLGLTPRSIYIYVKYRQKLYNEKKANAALEALAHEEQESLKLRRMSISELTDFKSPPENEETKQETKSKNKFRIHKKDHANSDSKLYEGDETKNKGPVFIEPESEYDKYKKRETSFIVDETLNTEKGVIKAGELKTTRGFGDEVGDDFKLETVFSENADPKSKSLSVVNELSAIDNSETDSEIEALSESDGDVEYEEIDEGIYMFPPIDLLPHDVVSKDTDNSEELRENAQILVETLESFNIGIKEITYSRGPTITRYELKPEAGIRVRTIANLVDDIALGLATTGVRIEAPIPNKPAVGIEVPNRNRMIVYLRDMMESDKFTNETSKLTACLGRDVAGKPIYFNIAKMPHLLVAGATGMGKSVCINSIILSLLYKAKASELKLILIDPKKVEFNIYKDIPHLYAPIVTDPKKAAGALATAVFEMERRFELIEEVGVRDITNYNLVTADDPDKEYMPQMVIIIDELADLMMTAPDEVETSIARLTAKARAAGIHLIIGTQRPSVDVITGTIKANIPSRIAFTVASQIDSRTIIDIAGAEKLIGMGDMLFAPVGVTKPLRVQGAFVHENDVEQVVDFIRRNNRPVKYNEAFIRQIEEEAAKCALGKKGIATDSALTGEDGDDVKLRDAIELAIDSGKISTSLLQRRISVGYGRAAKLIDRMEELGYVSAPEGNKPRRVLITKEMYMEKVVNDDLDIG